MALKQQGPVGSITYMNDSHTFAVTVRGGPLTLSKLVEITCPPTPETLEKRARR